MDYLINEVDEDLRRERLQDLWRRLGSYVVGISLLIVLGTAALVGWKNYTQSKQEAITSKLLQVTTLAPEENTNSSETHALLQEVVQTADPELGAIAAIASLQNASKETPALPLPTSAEGSIYGELYALLSGDKDSRENLASSTGTLSALAREQKAFALLADNKQAEALEILNRLKASATTPRDVQARAALVLSKFEQGDTAK